MGARFYKAPPRGGGCPASKAGRDPEDQHRGGVTSPRKTSPGVSALGWAATARDGRRSGEGKKREEKHRHPTPPPHLTSNPTSTTGVKCSHGNKSKCFIPRAKQGACSSPQAPRVGHPLVQCAGGGGGGAEPPSPARLRGTRRRSRVSRLC